MIIWCGALFSGTWDLCHIYFRCDNTIISYARNPSGYSVKYIIFCKGEQQIELPQEAVPEVTDLSPVLFEDSPSSSPGLPSLEGISASGGPFEVFGTSVEDAVREMRFRIEQKTMLTASAGECKTTVM